MHHLGDRLKALRQKEGLTQAALAPSINLTSAAAISAIEAKGKASTETIDAICGYFKVSKEWLLNGDGEAPQGVVIKLHTDIAANPYENALINELKQENERLWLLVEKLSGAQVAKVNFHNASTAASATGKVVPITTAAIKPGAQVGACA